MFCYILALLILSNKTFGFSIEAINDSTLRKVFYQRNESSYGCGAHSVPASSSNRKLRFPQRNSMAGMSSLEQCTIRAAKRTVGFNYNIYSKCSYL